MIAPMNTAPIRAARHAPSQSGGSGGSFMLFVGCAGGRTRRGWLGEGNYIFRQVAYRLINVTSSGQLSFKLLFADATKPKSISNEVLGLIFGSNYNFKAVVFHVIWFRFSRHQRRHEQDATPPPGSKDFFRLFSLS
jgi:hypothetical protein